MSSLPEGLKAYLRAPFVVIVWVMETYAKNRDRLKRFLARDKVARVFKITITITVMIWIGVALVAKEEDGQRLTDAVKSLWSDAQDLSEQRKAQQVQQETAQ